MRRQEENDRVPDDAEIDDELDELDDDLDDDDDLDEVNDESQVPVRRDEIEHADKGRKGDASETDDRVAWTEDEDRKGE